MTISLKKISTFSPVIRFRGKIAIKRHLEGFLEKSEEIRIPLKLKNNWGLLSDIFLHKVSLQKIIRIKLQY